MFYLGTLFYTSLLVVWVAVKAGGGGVRLSKKLKAVIHPEIQFLSIITHPHVIPNP